MPGIAPKAAPSAPGLRPQAPAASPSAPGLRPQAPTASPSAPAVTPKAPAAAPSKPGLGGPGAGVESLTREDIRGIAQAIAHADTAKLRDELLAHLERLEGRLARLEQKPATPPAPAAAPAPVPALAPAPVFAPAPAPAAALPFAPSPAPFAAAPSPAPGVAAVVVSWLHRRRLRLRRSYDLTPSPTHETDFDMPVEFGQRRRESGSPSCSSRCSSRPSPPSSSRPW